MERRSLDCVFEQKDRWGQPSRGSKPMNARSAERDVSMRSAHASSIGLPGMIGNCTLGRTGEAWNGFLSRPNGMTRWHGFSVSALDIHSKREGSRVRCPAGAARKTQQDGPDLDLRDAGFRPGARGDPDRHSGEAVETSATLNSTSGGAPIGKAGRTGASLARSSQSPNAAHPVG